MRSVDPVRMRSNTLQRGRGSNGGRVARTVMAVLLALSVGHSLARMTEFEEVGVSREARACYLAQRVLATYEPRAYPLQVYVADVGGGSILGRRLIGLPIDVVHAYSCYYLFPLTVYA